MSNERLERIKERVNYHGHLDDDIEFLIEQAEKNMTCQEVLELQKDALKGLLEQNKRYRETIKSVRSEIKYALYSNKSEDVKRHYLQNAEREATEALEGEGE